MAWLRLSTAVSGLLLLAGCGGSTAEPPAGPASTAPTTTVEATPTTPVPPDDVRPLDVVEPGSDPRPALLIGDTTGAVVRVSGEEELVLATVEGELRRAVPDGGGGALALVVDAQQLAALWWYRSGTDPLLLRSQGGLALHDLASRNDLPAAVITSSPIDATEPVQLLDVLDLDTTSARTVGEVGDDDSGVIDVAAGDDGFAVSRVDGECASVVSIDDTGTTVGDAVLGPVCGIGPVPYGVVAASPDLATVVVVETTDRGLALALRRDDEIVQHLLPAEITSVTDLDLAGDQVLLAGEDGVHLVDLAAATITELGRAAVSARFVIR